MIRTGGDPDFTAFYLDRGWPVPQDTPHIRLTKTGVAYPLFAPVSSEDKSLCEAHFTNARWPQTERIVLPSVLKFMLGRAGCTEKEYSENRVMNKMTCLLWLIRNGILKHHMPCAPAKSWSLIRPTRYAPVLADAEGETWVLDNKLDMGICPFYLWRG